MKSKPMNGLYWAYYAPDGYLQVRTICKNKADSGYFLIGASERLTDYTKAGYALKRIRVMITEVKP